jgi:protein SCO1
MRKRLLPLLIFTLFLAACKSKPKIEPRHYDLDGKIIAVHPDTKTLTIDAKAMPGYMEAMTMDYKVRNNDGVFSYAKPGDNIQAQLVLDPDGEYLDQVVIARLAVQDNGSSTSPVHLPQAGDQVPEFAFTNQGGKKTRLSALRGRPVLVTFIYTRCPLPDYCVRMSSNFGEIEKQLKQSDPKLYDRLQVLSVSIDPKFDTPKVLHDYGKNYAAQVDPQFQHWWFVSSSPAETRKFADFFGLSYIEEKDQIVHSLRTALIGADGKIAAVYNGNEWKAADVIGDLKSMR